MTTTDLFGFFKPKDVELAAIWINKTDHPDVNVVDASGKSSLRIAPDSLIAVKDGKLSGGEPTHRVIGCFAKVSGFTEYGHTVLACPIGGDVPEVVKV